MDILLAEVAKRCRQTAASDSPKYRRLMAALQDTIKSGMVVPGDRLPTEKAIASALPFALGTVQKALNGLVAQGLLRRNRRSGTFVSDTARPLDDMSQFVFERADGSGIGAVLTEITDIDITHDTGRWADMLGDCPAGYVRITRLDRIDRDFLCYVEMHLRADRYSDLLTETPGNLSGKNIRTVLETRYGIAVTNLEIAVAAAPASHRAATSLKLSKDIAVLQINVTGYDSGSCAAFTQTAFAPSGPYEVKFRSDIR
ncbi:MAG: GntR family transcriptional regulator [Paracoccaceae bacterium]|jgi:GntR family transcriptional regulator